MVLYRDREGKRCQETFDRKKDADVRQAEIKVDMRKGTHVAASKSPLVSAAAEAWLRSAEASGLGRSTQAQYRQHVELHIVPLIGHLKLVNFTAQQVRKFEDDLRELRRSRQMIRKVVASLGTLLADAQERGLAAHNPVRDLRRNRKKGKDHRAEKREKGRLKVGLNIPTVEEVTLIVSSAQGRWRPLLTWCYRPSDVGRDSGHLRYGQRRAIAVGVSAPVARATKSTSRRSAATSQ